MNLIFVLVISTFIFSSSHSTFNWSELTIVGKIKKNKDISAISCINPEKCLIASDETNFVQMAKIHNNEIIVSSTMISLGDFLNENDVEALTNDGVYFYAIGSHSLSRKLNQYQSSRYYLFKIFIGNNDKEPAVESINLEKLLNTSELSQYLYLPSEKNGIDIEGLSYKDHKLYLGFRSPVIDGKAIVMKLDARQIFSDDIVQEKSIIQIDLGQSRGIRSLESHQEKFYLLAGNSNDLPSNDASLFIFNQSFELEQEVSIPFKEDKAEALEILNSNTFILLFDSQKNGNPIKIELFP